MRILFMGSPVEAVAPLLALQRCRGVEIVAVVSQPSRPQGRGLTARETAVAQFAGQQGLELYQPVSASADDFVASLAELRIDVIVSAAYGQILSAEFLAVARRAVINIHPSYLPHLRGATPVVSAIVGGEREIGVTICFTIKRLDAGNIIIQERHPLPADTDHRIVTAAMFARGAKLLPEALERLRDPHYRGTKQDESMASYCRKITKNAGRIVWQKDGAQQVYRKYLAYRGWPEVHTTFADKRLIFHELRADNVGIDGLSEPGRFVFDERGLRVATADGALIVDKLQIAGKRVVDGKSFWNGANSRKIFQFI